MVAVKNDVSPVKGANVLALVSAAKVVPSIVKAASSTNQPCDTRTISQILRDSNGGFSFRR
jgi:hypothetical protein